MRVLILAVFSAVCFASDFEDLVRLDQVVRLDPQSGIGSVSSIAYSRGRWAIVDASAGDVYQFGPNGEYERVIGANLYNRKPRSVYSVLPTKEGFALISSHGLYQFSVAGALERYTAMPGIIASQGVDITENGSFLMAGTDYRSETWHQVVDSSGDITLAFGERHSDVDIATRRLRRGLGSDGALVVGGNYWIATAYNSQVEIYGSGGVLLKKTVGVPDGLEYDDVTFKELRRNRKSPFPDQYKNLCLFEAGDYVVQGLFGKGSSIYNILSREGELVHARLAWTPVGTQLRGSVDGKLVAVYFPDETADVPLTQLFSQQEIEYLTGAGLIEDERSDDLVAYLLVYEILPALNAGS